MTVDDLLDGAREIDPNGYSREALRAMYNGSRRFQTRAMAAMIRSVGAPAEDFPEFKLALTQYYLDDRIHGLETALSHLEKMGTSQPISLTSREIQKIPIRGRSEAVEDGARKARDLKRRRRG